MKTDSNGVPQPDEAADGDIHVLYVGGKQRDRDRISERLPEHLERASVTTASTAAAGLERLDGRIDCVVCEPPLPDEQAETVLKRVRERKPALPTIILSEETGSKSGGSADREHATAVLPIDGEPDHATLAMLIDGLVRQYRTSEETAAPHSLCEETLKRLPETALLTDADGTFQWIDPAVESLFGLSVEAVAERGTIESLFGGELIDRDSLTRDAATTVETTISTAEGEQRTVEVRAAIYEPVAGVVLYTVRELSDTKRLQVELHETKQALDTILSNAPVIMYTLDETGEITRSQGAAFSRLGVDPDHAVGQSVFDVYSHRPDICGQVERALSGESMNTTVEMESAVFESCYEPILDEGEVTGVVGLAIDITERERRQRELETYETALNTAADMIYQMDPDGRFLMVNDAAVEETGYGRSELIGEDVSTILTDESYERGQEMIQELVRDGSRDVATQEFELETADGDRILAESRITALYGDDGEFRGTIGITRDISRRKEYERMLSDLHDISLGLLTRHEPHAVMDQVVVALNKVLDIDIAGVFRFDQNENVLEPAATLEPTHELLDHVPTFGPGDGLVWDVFVSGEGRVYDDVRQAENLYNPETPIRSEVLVPLGDHGVLVCGSTEVAKFDDQTVELIDLLAATTETVLDRIDRDRRLQESDHELQKRVDSLAHKRTVEERLRRITTQIVDAETREEIYETVCRGLAALEECTFVWTGEPVRGRSALECQAKAGAGNQYLDSVPLTLQGQSRDVGTLPAVRTIEQSTPVVVSRVADSLRAGEWQPEALSRDFQSVVSVPIASNGFTHGTLSVYASTTEAFDDELQSALAELGETMAHALNSVERQQSLAGGAAVEVECRLEGTGTPALSLADELEAPVIIEDAVPGAPTLLYGGIHGVEPEEFHTACTALDTIDSGTVLRTSGTQLTVRLTVTERTAAETVAECGGAFRDLAIADGTGRLRVSFANEVRTSDAIQRIVGSLPSAELHSRKQRTTADDSSDGLETLTGRQREALLTAYHGGYYEWPREQSADDLSDVLGVTKSTFLEHLRRAERKLLGNGVPERFDV